MINLIIVDDSYFILRGISTILEDIENVNVVDKFISPRQALEFLDKNFNINLILLDVNMPEIDGVEFTKIIKEKYPSIHIILITAYESSNYKVAQALSYGAIDVIQKPDGREKTANIKAVKDLLIEKISIVHKLVRKNHSYKPTSDNNINNIKNRYGIILIGSSTGGPATLCKILNELPGNFNIPIIIVQHTTTGYAPGLVRVLQNNCLLPVKLVSAFMKIENGTVYVADTDYHVQISKNQRLRLIKSAPENGFRPSVSVLFKSAAQNYKGNVLGIVLTGMGNDGLTGCQMLKEHNQTVVIQDEQSSVIWGMPGSVYKAGWYDKMLSIDGISKLLRSV